MDSGAVDDYLLWELTRKAIRKALESSPLSRDCILQCMGLARELIAGFSHDVKMQMVQLFSPFSLRAFYLEKKHWSLRAYPVSKLGTVMPRVGDLPPEEIVKSFVGVVDYVRHQVESNSNSESVKYIRSMTRIADILETVPLMVIEPGNEQRRLEVMVRFWGKQDWMIHEAKGYIEDGNHRALALMLSNPQRKSLSCWIGT